MKNVYNTANEVDKYKNLITINNDVFCEQLLTC